MKFFFNKPGYDILTDKMIFSCFQAQFEYVKIIIIIIFIIVVIVVVIICTDM